MKKLFSTALISLATLSIWAQEVSYNLSMPKPQNHYFNVEMNLQDFSNDYIDIQMPIWAPGSYLAREFPKNVNLVKAKNQNGKELEVYKTSKNTWRIEKNKKDDVVVNYEVYAFELSVRTSFLDLTHGYLNGTSVFMYPKGHKDLGGELNITPYKDFKKITTALPKAGDGVANDNNTQRFTYNNYDHLADCPIEIGNQEEFSFQAAGVKHNVAIYGEGNYDVEKLKVDMAKIVESATSIFGENPNKEYWFIIHNTLNGGGGLEHTNSTTLNVNRWSYEGGAYLGFLSLVAHEYFHLWNVKRIRPDALGPFNYNEENYTSLLWVMEGFTSYYDELILRRAGFYSEQQYLGRLKSTLNYVEGSEGNKVQPVAHASFDAWIKSYRPNENSANTTISYYSKGNLLALVIDAMIIDKYQGEKSLDDFMQVLYNKFYKKLNRGFSEDEFQAELEDFLDMDLNEFFRDFVYGVETIPYNKYLSKIGLEVKDASTTTPSFGSSVSEQDGKLMVRRIRANSAAEDAGLSVNDEILSINGYRMDAAKFSSFLGTMAPGDSFTLIVSRDDVLRVLEAKMGEHKQDRYEFVLDTAENSLARYWLRLQ
ncbi:M61 family metallopeptidase [Lishizhenia sp.]|uniref:M61 family metallopeptidase n=1 Tax=Lishizhenia sp. TaxID=2497594 RepID=UPI00299D59BC|nr:PDZ domain-containing protein [Lishizhenia sp.]MDX1446692.1 PDZ domain-containing protein [Lishizhenia sp.]